MVVKKIKIYVQHERGIISFDNLNSNYKNEQNFSQNSGSQVNPLEPTGF